MILQRKFHIPQSRIPLVVRPGLTRKLNAGLQSKMTLLSAQAGYGKTTALSEWVKQYPGLIAWVSLDKYDNDWVQFWTYVTASITEQIPEFGETVLSQLGMGPSDSVEPAISSLLNELNTINMELVIMLDDYHFIELPSINSSMAYLLEHLPPHIHLYIASRTELPIFTARLLAKGELHRLTMQDLQFQLDEGLAFFQDSAQLVLAKEQVMELLDQTEGWISGLQLAALSLKHSPNIADTIHQFGGHQHQLSDYLLEEVFRHQSEAVRSFLLQTSILSRMNSSLCEAVTGDKNSQERLEWLEQINLFIVPLDEHRDWYRYHHLLSDFLQQMRRRMDSNKREQDHQHAAGWLERHDFDEEAVEHYIEGKQYADAVRLIEKNLSAFVQTKSTVLNRWLSVLPEDSFAENPMLDLFYASTLLGVGQWEAAFRRVEQAEMRYPALQHQWGEAVWKQAMGNVYFFRAVASYLQKDLQQVSAYLELVEQFIPEGSFFQTVGRNRYQGYDSFDDLLSYINDLHAADEFLLRWIRNWGNKKKYPFIGYLYAAYIQLLYEWNRMEEAEFYAFQGLERLDVRPFARIMIRIAVSTSRLQQARGNPHRASEVFEQLKLQLNTPDYYLFMLEIEAEQASLSLKQGSTGDAFDWLLRCGLLPTDELTLKRAAEYLVLARVLMEQERLDDALFLLERLYRLFCKEDRLRDRIKVLILQSLTLHKLGRVEDALQPLEVALQLGEPEGYVRSFVDERGPMDELLKAYLKARKKNVSNGTLSVSIGYVKKLLHVLNVMHGENMHIQVTLTEKESKVLELINNGMSNKEISYELHVSRETVKSHVKNIYRKLSVNNRIQALQRAHELEFLI